MSWLIELASAIAAALILRVFVVNIARIKGGSMLPTLHDRDIALVFSLIDMRHPPTADDVQMINFLIDNEFPFVVVCTKSDKLSKRQQAERLEALQTELPYGDEITIIPFSAKTGEGVDRIKAIIEEMNEE